MTAKIRVQAQHLLAGDVVGSGEKVLSVSAGLHTPAGKVEVRLEKLDGMRSGSRRTAVWGARTLINARREAV